MPNAIPGNAAQPKNIIMLIIRARADKEILHQRKYARKYLFVRKQVKLKKAGSAEAPTIYHVFLYKLHSVS